VPVTAVPDGSGGDRLRGLRRMKLGAAALLVLALIAYIATYRAANGGEGWVGFGRAAAEAAMVGGLADWFAVTALFRRPLGLPIPHTALIPRRKDAIGRSLQSFVGENFLTESAVRQQLVHARAPYRIGTWLAGRGHAERVATELSALAASAVRLLADEDLQVVAAQAIRKKVAATSFAPYLGRLLGPLVHTGSHLALVDLGVSRVLQWLTDNEDSITSMIENQAPYWTPRFVDRSVARRVHAELVRVATEVNDDPEHPLRRQLDEFLVRFAKNLQEDSSTRDHVDRIVTSALGRPEVDEAVNEFVASGRTMIAEQLERPSGELRERIVSALRQFGTRLETDEVLGARIDDAAGRVTAYALTHFREELTRVIADTIDRWDGNETSRRVELQIGRDLQYIRVNGTVVGALAGVAIHALAIAF